ncbi:hypothetical protein VCHA53O466_40456 [Vibrio chagasii]|nr:hypothetical protein VCHA53O466_40456 [Vibrio chagasii]
MLYLTDKQKEELTKQCLESASEHTDFNVWESENIDLSITARTLDVHNNCRAIIVKNNEAKMEREIDELTNLPDGLTSSQINTYSFSGIYSEHGNSPLLECDSYPLHLPNDIKDNLLYA